MHVQNLSGKLSKTNKSMADTALQYEQTLETLRWDGKSNGNSTSQRSLEKATP